MSKLPITITRAGLERFTAAQLDEDIDLGISSVALTDAVFVVAPTLDELPGEFRRLSTISGDQVGGNIVHMTIRDDDPVGYTARGFGLFLADGTLFAVYGQDELLFQKSPLATFLAAIDIAFPTGDVSELNFGNTDFLNSPATSERAGVVQLATLAEAQLGQDARRVPSVEVIGQLLAGIRGLIDALAESVIEALAGISGRTVFGAGLVVGGGRNDTNRVLTVTAATGEQVSAGQAANVVVTPAALGALSANFASTGEYSVPGGPLIKIGSSIGVYGEGSVTVDFITPFPTACLGVWLTPINANGNVLRDIYMQERSIGPSGFTAFVQKAGSDGVNIDGFRWRAEGY